MEGSKAYRSKDRELRDCLILWVCPSLPPHLDDFQDKVFVNVEEEPLLSGQSRIGSQDGLVGGQILQVFKLTTEKTTMEI